MSNADLNSNSTAYEVAAQRVGAGLARLTSVAERLTKQSLAPAELGDALKEVFSDLGFEVSVQPIAKIETVLEPPVAEVEPVVEAVAVPVVEAAVAEATAVAVEVPAPTTALAVEISAPAAELTAVSVVETPAPAPSIFSEFTERFTALLADMSRAVSTGNTAVVAKAETAPASIAPVADPIAIVAELRKKLAEAELKNATAEIDLAAARVAAAQSRNAAPPPSSKSEVVTPGNSGDLTTFNGIDYNDVTPPQRIFG